MTEPTRRFPAPWHSDKIPGGYVIRDANGQALAYAYARATQAEAAKPKCSRQTRRAGSRLTSRGCPSYCGPLIKSKYDSLPTNYALAARLGWSRRHVSRIASNRLRHGFSTLNCSTARLSGLVHITCARFNAAQT
jgi:hypothetical protein